MIALHAVFWAFVIVFALIGALRGVAKEILVSTSIVGVMFLFSLLQQFAPAIWESLTRDPATGFFAETIAIALAAIFGYAGPALSVQLAGRAKREKGVEIIAGFVRRRHQRVADRRIDPVLPAPCRLPVPGGDPAPGAHQPGPRPARLDATGGDQTAAALLRGGHRLVYAVDLLPLSKLL